MTNQLIDKEGEQIGSQSAFNKFAGSTAIGSIPNQGEFDKMGERLEADASAMRAFEDAEHDDALKDLAQYEANANAPEGTMGAVSPEQITQPAPTEPRELVRQ